MRTSKFNSLLIFGLLLCAAHAAAQVPEKDTQSWNDVQLTIPMTRKVDFLIQGTLRVGDNLTSPVDERWGVAFNYKFNKYLTLGQSFFSRNARAPHARIREREDRLTLGAMLQKPIGKFTLSDRNAFERRWRAPQVDAWRYRNRVRLEHPFQIDKTKFTWFISDEVFYDWSLHDWVRNRAAIGAYHAFNKHFTLELYYMRQNDGRSRPGDLHIIGTQWRFKL
jgi:Protein of unknown function (DUF2490)